MWKKVPEFEGYKISETGEIARNRKKLSPATNEDGYKTVVLYKDGKPHFKYIHILVAQAFDIPNPEGHGIVNHRDGDKSNCHYKNLYWASPSQNTQHAYDKGLEKPRKGEKNGKSKLSAKDVQQVKKSDKSGKELAKQHDVTPAAISLIKTASDGVKMNHILPLTSRN